MTTIPFTNLQSQYISIKKEIDVAIKRVFFKSQFIGGKEVEKFEQEFAKYLGVKYVVAVNSGTDALILGIKGLELPSGSEIIIPTNTFFSTALAATSNNLKPVFSDIDENDYGINLEDVKRKISSRTKAIILVHMYGQSDKIDEIKNIIKESGKKIYLIEDSCQTHGGNYKNEKAGTYGIFSAFSFYPTKNLGAYGDGGAIATNDKNLSEKYRLLRQYGSIKKYYHESIGFNSRLDSLQAAILRIKLKYLDSWITKRQETAVLYNKLLSKLFPYITIPNEFIERMSTYYVYVVRAKNRDNLMRFLKLHGITALIHYPIPLHLQKAYSYLGYRKGDFPIVENVSKEILSLPMFENISKKQIKYVVKTISQFYK